MSWVEWVVFAAVAAELLVTILILIGTADELGRYADDTNPYGRDEDKE